MRPEVSHINAHWPLWPLDVHSRTVPQTCTRPHNDAPGRNSSAWAVSCVGLTCLGPVGSSNREGRIWDQPRSTCCFQVANNTPTLHPSQLGRQPSTLSMSGWPGGFTTQPTQSATQPPTRAPTILVPPAHLVSPPPRDPTWKTRRPLASPWKQ